MKAGRSSFWHGGFRATPAVFRTTPVFQTAAVRAAARLLAVASVGGFGVATAGLLDEMDDASRHLAYCKQAADDATADGKPDIAKGAWSVCLSEAKRRGFETIVPSLRAQVAISEALAEHAPLQQTQTHQWAMAVLTVAAEYAALDLPSDDVRLTFRAWMGTDEGRAYVEDVRTVTVVWDGLKETQRPDETLQRSIEDCGLKWSTPGATDVDTIVYASLAERATSLIETLASGEKSKAGTYAHAETTLTISKVRFKTRDASGKGFATKAAADHAEPDAARDASTATAADLAARVILQRALAELFPPSGD